MVAPDTRPREPDRRTRDIHWPAVADNETFTFTFADEAALFVVFNSGTNAAGSFFADKNSTTIVELADPDTEFDVTDVDNSKIAVFKSSSSAVVSVKNYQNATRELKVTVLTTFITAATAPA